MKSKKRLFVYFLISLFSILFVKNLSSNFFLTQNCDEVGHVHGLKEKAEGDHCHSGKSIFSVLPLHRPVFSFRVLGLDTSFTFNFDPDVAVQAPFLEGPRKPPRL